MGWLPTLLGDEEAATAVEYSVMLALILLVCIALIAVIGFQTRELFDPDGSLSGAMAN